MQIGSRTMWYVYTYFFKAFVLLLKYIYYFNACMCVGATVQMVDITEHSLSADKVVARYDEYLTNNSKVKLAVIGSYVFM